MTYLPGSAIVSPLDVLGKQFPFDGGAGDVTIAAPTTWGVSNYLSGVAQVGVLAVNNTLTIDRGLMVICCKRLTSTGSGIIDISGAAGGAAVVFSGRKPRGGLVNLTGRAQGGEGGGLLVILADVIDGVAIALKSQGGAGYVNASNGTAAQAYAGEGALGDPAIWPFINGALYAGAYAGYQSNNNLNHAHDTTGLGAGGTDLAKVAPATGGDHGVSTISGSNCGGGGSGIGGGGCGVSGAIVSAMPPGGPAVSGGRPWSPMDFMRAIEMGVRGGGGGGAAVPNAAANNGAGGGAGGGILVMANTITTTPTTSVTGGAAATNGTGAAQAGADGAALVYRIA